MSCFKPRARRWLGSQQPNRLSQIFYLSLFIFAFALVGAFYPYNRGGLYTALIVTYALTASIAGYVASSYYRQMEGELWVRNILLTCFIYCGPFFIMFSFLNTVAIIYRVGRGMGTWAWAGLPRWGWALSLELGCHAV